MKDYVTQTDKFIERFKEKDLKKKEKEKELKKKRN